MRVAIVCSAHGYGHVTRQLVVAGALARRGCESTLFSAAPAAIVRDAPVRLVRRVVDVGIAQRDSLTEDPAETVARLERVVTEAAIDALARDLAGFDRVVVDVAPPALEAARRAGVPALAVGNFDWAWIYRQYAGLEAWGGRFAEWQAPHPAIALSPGPGMHGFAEVTPVGVVGRKGRPTPLGPGVHALVCFGGLGLEDVDALLPRIPGLTWIFAPPMRAPARADVRFVDDVPFPDLVASADVLLTKPGYGIQAEAALAGARIVWLDRGVFPEAPSMEEALRARGDVKVQGRGADAVADAVVRRLENPRPTPIVTEAAERVVDRIVSRS